MTSKKREGIVYSTNPEFKYNSDALPEANTLIPEKQLLYVWLDSKKRKGKTVTLIKGFIGTKQDLESLAGEVKRHCGTGGAAKDGEILIQGDCREKIITFLVGRGYKTKKAGG
ncbi:MAG: translation initiation factor [Bacteroidales bacterium]|nr:translation initiation factor [Bacteroidales bacterium]